MITYKKNRWFCLEQIFLIIFLSIGSNCLAQDKTIGPKVTANPKEVVSKHSIMIIPFENRMYLSEIDILINKETKLNAKQIKAVMRDGINEQLYKKLKAKMKVVDLLDDTVKTKKDLENIYQYLTYQYQRIPNQEDYKPPLDEKIERGVNKGQITVETNSDARFMNAKVKNATLVPYLNLKYKTDLFLFVNELDIKSLNPTMNLADVNSTRKIILHYTVYTLNAKEINSGVAELDLPNNVNNPSKIISNYFSQIAVTIANRIEKAILLN